MLGILRRSGSGRELWPRLLELRPEMKVLFPSGYTDDAHRGVLDPGIAFLQKRLLPEALAPRVREALDTPPR